MWRWLLLFVVDAAVLVSLATSYCDPECDADLHACQLIHRPSTCCYCCRFYWNKEVDDVVISQCTGNFRYGFEYMGLNGRLVSTWDGV